MSVSIPPGLGTRVVADALGVDHPADLLARHYFLSPHGQMAALIVDAAWKVDDLDHKIVRRSRSAYRELQSLERGVSGTVLGTFGADINVLADRRSQGADHVEALTGAYRRSLPQAEDPPAHERVQTAARKQATTGFPGTGRNTAHVCSVVYALRPHSTICDVIGGG